MPTSRDRPTTAAWEEDWCCGMNMNKALKTKRTTAKVIWQKATSHNGGLACKRNLVDIFLSYLSDGSTCREVDPWLCIWNPHSGDGEVLGRESAMVPFEIAMMVSYSLHCDNCVDHSVAFCTHFGEKFEGAWVNLCKPNFKANWENMGLSYVKNRVDIFCRLSIMHERDRQTNRQTTER